MHLLVYVYCLRLLKAKFVFCLECIPRDTQKVVEGLFGYHPPEHQQRERRSNISKGKLTAKMDAGRRDV